MTARAYRSVWKAQGTMHDSYVFILEASVSRPISEPIAKSSNRCHQPRCLASRQMIIRRSDSAGSTPYRLQRSRTSRRRGERDPVSMRLILAEEQISRGDVVHGQPSLLPQLAESVSQFPVAERRATFGHLGQLSRKKYLTEPNLLVPVYRQTDVNYQMCLDHCPGQRDTPRCKTRLSRNTLIFGARVFELLPAQQTA